jgi:hypothetical protein
MLFDSTDVLVRKNELIKLLPTHSHDMSRYNHLFEKEYNFYCLMMCISNLLSDTKKRANKNSFDFDLTLKYLVELWVAQQGRCALTGKEFSLEPGSLQSKNPFKISIDRVDNNKGYVKSNIRFLTHWANNAKSTWTDQIFLEFVKSTSRVLNENA